MPGRKKAPPEPANPGIHPATDPTTPDRSLPFPIVAIGASAGGIEACTSLLRALPEGTGMAFVVVQHLAPAHESLLPEILGRATRMKVAEVAGDTPVEAERVYVIPPGKNLVFSHGSLRVSARTEARGVLRPVDVFMRSLAEEHGHKSIGVVLSGTASDGTLGLEEIKAAGGITFAQDSTAQQEGMPRSAIATGAVDFVLPPDEIAHELGRIARHPYVAPTETEPGATQEPAFARVLELMRQATGVDFSNYKRNTLHRRITRRMVLHKLEGLRDYVRFLQARPEEVEALFHDVLINVTSFFRNPDAFEALKAHVFSRLTSGRNRHDPLRVWALGCSTGEEAYSIAMAFTEYVEAHNLRVSMQVFATDVNGFGIERARAGLYPKAIAQDVSPERLRRFFAEVDGSYRIAKPIRDMCVFARQNALSDPPFSRLDLVACRNMLIYLEPVLQQRLLPLLHYALRPDGFLWLGGSETIGSYRDLFDLVDPKHKIYARRTARASAHPRMPIPAGRWSVPAVAQASVPPARDPAGDAQREADRMLLARYAPPGVVINEQLEIVQFRGDTGPYLAPAPGRASLGFLKMLREGLMVPVREAVQKARRDKAAVREEGLRVRSDGGWREVDVVVLPMHDREGLLVLFEEPAHRIEARARQMAEEASAAHERIPPASDEEGRLEIARLKQELTATREYLQSVIEEQETANEELQSANEELATVNDELQNRNQELSRTNNDLGNLLASVSMAIVMLGPDLRIRRFTQTAEKILNLIHSDVGRPLSDIKLNIGLPEPEALIAEVIETVSVREREVQDRNGRWYSLRVRPYRTFDNKIDGAVLVLVDIDSLKRAEHSLRESEQRFEALADSTPALIWVDDVDGCRFVNRAFQAFVGVPEAEVRRMGVAAFVHPDERQDFAERYGEALRRKEPFTLRARLRRADGSYRWMKTVAMPRVAAGDVAGFVGSSLDVTDMAEAEQARLELDWGKDEFLALLADELRGPLSGVREAARRLAGSPGPEDVERARAAIDREAGQMARVVDDLLEASRHAAAAKEGAR